MQKKTLEDPEETWQLGSPSFFLEDKNAILPFYNSTNDTELEIIATDLDQAISLIVKNREKLKAMKSEDYLQFRKTAKKLGFKYSERIKTKLGDDETQADIFIYEGI